MENCSANGLGVRVSGQTPEQQPELEPFPEFARASRATMAKSLGVLAITVIAAAGLGGAIGLGIYWAGQGAEDPVAHGTIVQKPAQSTDKGTPKHLGAENDVVSGAAESMVAPFGSAWLIPGDGLDDASRESSLYLYGTNGDGLSSRLSRMATLFGVSSPVRPDGYGGYSTNPESEDGWFSASPSGLGYWNFMANATCFDEVPLPMPVPEPMPAPMKAMPDVDSGGETSGVSPGFPGRGFAAYPCGTDDNTAPISEASAREVVEPLLAALNVLEPIEWDFPEPYGSLRQVMLYEVVDGARSGQVWQFEVDSEGAVVSASGHLASPNAVQQVRLVSPLEAVRRASTQPWASMVEPDYTTMTTPYVESCSADGACAVTPTQPTAPSWKPGQPFPLPVSQSTVDSAAPGWRITYLDDSVLLVPVWLVNDASGATWSIPAMSLENYASSTN